MRAILVALFLVGTLGPTPQFCLGAMAKQERATPKGEWCQRAEAGMPKQAHACGCHETDCKDADPSTLPAHTDSECLNFCTVSQCECPLADCK